MIKNNFPSKDKPLTGPSIEVIRRILIFSLSYNTSYNKN